MCPKCPGNSEASSRPFSDDAIERLRHWASHLLVTAWEIERTALFHGYTGRWEFELQLRKWRGLPIDPQSYAVVTGFLDLFICSERIGNLGSASGTLSCRITPSEGGPPFMADLYLVHTVSNIECTSSGGLELTSHLLRMDRIPEVPNLPVGLRAIGSGSEPWTFKWTLKPNPFGQLEGRLSTSGAGGTEGDVVARKLRFILDE
jgi:hypothetical protein